MNTGENLTTNSADERESNSSKNSPGSLVFCFCVPVPEPIRSGDVMAYACDEEGRTLSSHYCSSEWWARKDIMSECHHENYPAGFRLEWVGSPPENWEGADSSVDRESGEELLPCPFCGGEAEYEEDTGRVSGHVKWSIGCRDEDCFGFMSMLQFARRADARKAWNARRNAGLFADLVSALQDAVNDGHSENCLAIKGPPGENWTMDDDCDCWRKNAIEILSHVPSSDSANVEMRNSEKGKL